MQIRAAQANNSLIKNSLKSNEGRNQKPYFLLVAIK